MRLARAAARRNRRRPRRSGRDGPVLYRRDRSARRVPRARGQGADQDRPAARGGRLGRPARRQGEPRRRRGVAVREFVLEKGHGRVDYLLFVDGQPVGVIEAKTEGTTLIEVEHQSGKYVDGLPVDQAAGRPAAVRLRVDRDRDAVHERLDPDARSRQGVLVPPAGDARRVGPADHCDPRAPTFRHRLRSMPAARRPPLWAGAGDGDPQPRGVAGDDRPRALIQMATGSGKTFTAANVCYRLIKLRRRASGSCSSSTGRTSAGRPGSSRGSHRRTTAASSPSCTTCSTSRRTRSTPSRGCASRRSSGSTRSSGASRSSTRSSTSTRPTSCSPDEPVPVEYNPALPPETFDVVIVDECHRSIYGLWRQVLDYFDAHLDRPDRDAEQADVRVLQPEPRDGVRPRPGRRRRRQRRLRRLPDPHRDHRAGLDHRRRRLVTEFRDRQTRSAALGEARRGLTYGAERSSTARSSPRTRSAPSSRRSATGCSPRSSPAAARCRRR